MRRMDACTVNILRQTNNRFYAAQAASFSRTRQAPWPGWRCVLDAVCPGWRDRQEAGAPGAHEARGASEDPPHRGLSLIDLACGNLRFEAFLSAEAPGLVARTLAVDNCDPLVARGTRAGDVSFSSLDAVDALARGSLAADLDALLAEPADLAVCFGFAHHVPGAEMRADLVFDAAALEPGDCLLGWRDTDAIRYCHSFSDADLAALAACDSRAQVVARFDADGRTGRMNAYLVFRRMR